MKYLSTLACSIAAVLFLAWVVSVAANGLAPLGRLLAGGA